MTSLSLTLDLRPGEAAQDYISRLAARNGLSAVAPFCLDVGLDLRRIMLGCPEEIAILADMAGIPGADLGASTIRKEKNAFRIRGQRMARDSLRMGAIRVCPACLREDIAASNLPPDVAVYGRIAWIATSVRTCPAHGIALVELWKRENHDDRDFSAILRPRLDELDAMLETAHRRPASEHELYLLSRLEGRPGGIPFLDTLAPHVAARLSELVGILVMRGRGVRLASLNEDDLQLAGAIGMAILGPGEEGFRGFLRELQRNCPYGYRVKSGPATPIAAFRMWLAHRRGDADYDPVKAMVARHFSEDPPADIEDKRPRRPNDLRAFLRPRYSNDTGARRLIHSIMKPIEMPSEMPLTPLLTAEAAWQFLGCSLALFMALQTHGLIRPLVGAGGGWRHHFSLGDLQALLARLFEISAPSDRRRPAAPQIASITEAASRHGLTEIEIIRLILGNGLRWIGRQEGRTGMSALAVECQAIQSWDTRECFEGVPIGTAAGSLGLEPGALAFLVGLGALRVWRGTDPWTCARFDAVEAGSLDRFSRDHVELSKLADLMGRGPAETASWLAEAEVRYAYRDTAGKYAFYEWRNVRPILYYLNRRNPEAWPKEVHSLRKPNEYRYPY